jgi:hypothetical protein
MSVRGWWLAVSGHVLHMIDDSPQNIAPITRNTQIELNIAQSGATKASSRGVQAHCGRPTQLRGESQNTDTLPLHMKGKRPANRLNKEASTGKRSRAE